MMTIVLFLKFRNVMVTQKFNLLMKFLKGIGFIAVKRNGFLIKSSVNKNLLNKPHA